MDWFLEFCYGAAAPEGSMVQRCRDVTEDNVNDLIKEFEIPYAHVKPHLSKLTAESKARIAAYEKKLDTVIWSVFKLHHFSSKTFHSLIFFVSHEIIVQSCTDNFKNISIISDSFYRENNSFKRSFKSM